MFSLQNFPSFQQQANPIHDFWRCTFWCEHTLKRHDCYGATYTPAMENQPFLMVFNRKDGDSYMAMAMLVYRRAYQISFKQPEPTNLQVAGGCCTCWCWRPRSGESRSSQAKLQVPYQSQVLWKYDIILPIGSMGLVCFAYMYHKKID